MCGYINDWLTFSRDEALRQTRRLENEIAAEREKMRMLLGGMGLPVQAAGMRDDQDAY